MMFEAVRHREEEETVESLADQIDMLRLGNHQWLPPVKFSLGYIFEEDEYLRHFARSFIPSAKTVEAVKTIQSKCENALKDRFLDVRCELYGSRQCKLATTESDVDVCVFCDKEREKIRQLEDEGASDAEVKKKKESLAYNICNSLRKSDDFADVKAVAKARIPVVRAVDVASGLSVDLVFDNAVAVENSTLVRRYVEKDRRAKYLMFLVKIWAQRRLRDASTGGLSSYAHCIIAIFVLQQHRVVPNLQETTPQDENLAKWDEVFLGDLLISYFTLLSELFAQNRGTLSIRTGGYIPTPSCFSKNLVSIEDPYQHFESSHPRDLGVVLTQPGLLEITEEVKRVLYHIHKARKTPDPQWILFGVFYPAR